jgi:hypothetical protein
MIELLQVKLDLGFEAFDQPVQPFYAVGSSQLVLPAKRLQDFRFVGVCCGRHTLTQVLIHERYVKNDFVIHYPDTTFLFPVLPRSHSIAKRHWIECD